MERESRWARFRRSEGFSGLAMIAPPWIYAMLLLAAPMLTIIAVSFMTDGYLEILPRFTLSNYADAWSSPVFQVVLLRSVMVSILVTIVTVTLAFPIAYFISFSVTPSQKSLWIFLITIPFWTSYLIRVFLWKVILAYNGVINSVLKGIGIIDKPLDMLNSIQAITATLAHAYAPFAIIPIFVALEKIDRSLLEAGLDLGETRFATFLRVTLPLAMPGVLGAVVIVFIPTIGDYVTPSLIGGGKMPMIANLIQANMLDLDNKPMGAAIAVTAMAVVGGITGIGYLFYARMTRNRG